MPNLLSGPSESAIAPIPHDAPRFSNVGGVGSSKGSSSRLSPFRGSPQADGTIRQSSCPIGPRLAQSKGLRFLMKASGPSSPSSEALTTLSGGVMCVAPTRSSSLRMEPQVDNDQRLRRAADNRRDTPLGWVSSGQLMGDLIPSAGMWRHSEGHIPMQLPAKAHHLSQRYSGASSSDTAMTGKPDTPDEHRSLPLPTVVSGVLGPIPPSPSVQSNLEGYLMPAPIERQSLGGSPGAQVLAGGVHRLSARRPLPRRAVTERQLMDRAFGGIIFGGPSSGHSTEVLEPSRSGSSTTVAVSAALLKPQGQRLPPSSAARSRQAMITAVGPADGNSSSSLVSGLMVTTADGADSRRLPPTRDDFITHDTVSSLPRALAANQHLSFGELSAQFISGSASRSAPLTMFHLPGSSFPTVPEEVASGSSALAVMSIKDDNECARLTDL